MTADDLYRFVLDVEKRLSKAERAKFRRRMGMKWQEEQEHGQGKGEVKVGRVVAGRRG